MFFRFGSALFLVVLIALTGTTLEKQSLQLKRAISHQQYRLDALLDSHVRLRLEAQRLGTPDPAARSSGTAANFRFTVPTETLNCTDELPNSAAQLEFSIPIGRREIVVRQGTHEVRSSIHLF